MAWSISNAMMKDYENSRCSQELVAESLVVTCLDGEQSVPSSTTPTPDQYYWPDKTTEHSRLSRFGMTCVLLTESLGEDLLTWFLAGFPARISASQDLDVGLMEAAAGYGMRWLGSFATYNHVTSMWKTVQNLLVEDSAEYSGTWPKWGLMRNGVSSELVTQVHRMSAKEYGFVPTPTASNTKAHHMRGSDKGKQREPRSYGEHGPLNPQYLEWLMGWPEGWTELKPLATARFHEWRKQHGEF